MITYVSHVGATGSSLVPLPQQKVLSILIFHQSEKNEAKLCSKEVHQSEKNEAKLCSKEVHQSEKNEAKLCSKEVHRLPIQRSCKNILINTQFTV